METPRSLEQRFWQYTDRRGPDECWPWIGPVNSKGYGQLHVTRHKRRTATRYSWELRNGAPFPSDRLACHKCDNPRCVNPNHIWPGTHEENHRDSRAKGRRKPSFSEAQVRQIKELYRPYSKAAGSRALAARFGVHPCTILRALNGRDDGPVRQLNQIINAWQRAGPEAREMFLREIGGAR